jgi:GDPmannose 4,6-dehydratase
VYGNPEKTPITEDAPFHPLSPYAISKASADMIGRFYFEAYGLRVLTTRMFTHTGPRRGDVFAESSFAKQIAMIEIGQLDPPIEVGNLDSLRTVADVRDAVRAYYMLLTQNPIAGEVYNIGGTHVCTVGQILGTLCELARYDYPIEVDEARLRPLDATNQVPDCTKFMTHTNWQPKIPFHQTMIDLLSYWRERVKHGPVLQR